MSGVGDQIPMSMTMDTQSRDSTATGPTKALQMMQQPTLCSKNCSMLKTVISDPVYYYTASFLQRPTSARNRRVPGMPYAAHKIFAKEKTTA